MFGLKRNTHRRGFIGLREVLLLAMIVAGIGVSAWLQNGKFRAIGFRVENFRQKIKLPSSEALKFLTLGYDNVYANYLWLQSIQGFGAGWITEDKTTRPIFQYFDTLTDVDPQFISAYRFANLIIGDNRFDHVLGQEILRKGCFKNPANYDLPYLGVYNAIWQMDDLNNARWFARHLNRIKEAPDFMKRIGEFIERSAGRYDAAFEINVQYYIQYLVAKNDIEKEIITRRTQDLLDRLYREHLSAGVRRFLEETGDHPERMEQILLEKYTPTISAPTMPALGRSLEKHADVIDGLSKDQRIPQEIGQAVAKDAYEEIAGLPPDPFGTWYYIWKPARDSFLTGDEAETNRTRRELNEQPKGRPVDNTFPYIMSAKDSLMTINRAALSAQGMILESFNKTKAAPSEEELQPLLVRDPLGGRYVYDPTITADTPYGVFYSSAGKRISEGRDPRLGLSGRGPFPFSIEPRLSDFPEDREWGIKNGYVLEGGVEIWESGDVVGPLRPKK